MNWFKERVGIQEPIYGSSAIQPVTDQAKTTPWTELERKDLQWATPGATCVETQVFYVMCDSGHIAMAQIIYNCLAGIRTTCQFNCKIFYPDRTQTPLWTSDTLSNWSLDDSKTSFHADNCDFELSQDGSTFSVKSSTSKEAVVDFTCTRTAPGFVVGKAGTTYYGTDPQSPWGKMRHAFWPRCRSQGSIMTKSGEVSMSGPSMFIHALQDIKPNFAASSWNFIGFQGPTYSALVMEFTTPPSYGSTTVTVGGIASDGKLVCAGGQEHVKHTTTKVDEEIGWPEPQSASFEWKSEEEGDPVSAELSGPLGSRVDRVDVLAQIPGFLKVIIAQAAGTKPFIYQYSPNLPFKIKQKSGEHEEEGRAFMEATFITGS